MNKQSKVTVSIIVPVYKTEAFLSDCVDSILGQTFRDFELILVDDGSPDNCPAICDAYAQKDERVKVIHQENQGQAGARNAALDLAAGEYITFIDSDDIVNDRYLEKLLDAMKEDVDVTVCKFHNFTNDSKLDSCRIEGDMTYKSYDAESAVIAIFNGQISTAACGKLYRTSVIGINRFAPKRIHEDSLFTPLVCYRSKKTVFFEEELYYYRVHHNSTTHRKFTIKRYDAIWATDECIRFFNAKKETAIVNAARRMREYTIITYAIYAWRDKVTVPVEYKVNLLHAVFRLRTLTSDSYFEYYLALIHPQLALAHERLRKVKSILHLQ